MLKSLQHISYILFITYNKVIWLCIGRVEIRHKSFYIPSDHIIFLAHPSSISFNLDNTHFIVPVDYFLIPAVPFLSWLTTL